MSDQYVGEIRVVPFNFAPQGWAFCNGQLLSISQNTALFSLLGVNYGGDGRSTFALPNLQGSVPLHVGGGQGPGLSPYILGETGGEAGVTLLASQLPPHAHALAGSTATATATTPGPTVLLAAPPGNPRHPSTLYKAGAVTTSVPLDPSMIGPSGGGLPHNNVQPFLTLNFIIALQGIYPPRS